VTFSREKSGKHPGTLQSINVSLTIQLPTIFIPAVAFKRQRERRTHINWTTATVPFVFFNKKTFLKNVVLSIRWNAFDGNLP
jgi:hypothetical protein